MCFSCFRYLYVFPVIFLKAPAKFYVRPTLIGNVFICVMKINAVPARWNLINIVFYETDHLGIQRFTKEDYSSHWSIFFRLLI